MRKLVTHYSTREDYAMLKVLDILLKEWQNEWDGFNELHQQVQLLSLQQIATRSKKPQVTHEQFREALLRLFAVKDYHDKPLFKRANHWVAVMRVAIDWQLAEDDAPEAFVKWVSEMELPKELMRTLHRKNIGNYYNGIYQKPLVEWTDENYMRLREGLATGRKQYFYDMRSVAQKMNDLLSYYCQRQ